MFWNDELMAHVKCIGGQVGFSIKGKCTAFYKKIYSTAQGFTYRKIPLIV